MNVVITGGAGFLGTMLAERIASGGLILPDGTRLNEPTIRLADHPETPPPPSLGGQVRLVAMDVGDPLAVDRVIDHDTVAVFHLAAVVSAAAEADFDLGMRVNLEGTRNVLEAVRALERFVPVVSTSSLAVFGGALPERLKDDQVVRPESSYGTQKAIGELLCADYRRKGFCDARTLRLPTVVIRPGAPNKAASSFASSILREPLNGERAVCPVRSDLKLWIVSPENAIEGLLLAMRIPLEEWPRFGTVNLPGLSTTVSAMLAALKRKAGAEAVDLVSFQCDPAIDAIVSSWPGDFDTREAERLGFGRDDSVDTLIENYVTRHLQ